MNVLDLCTGIGGFTRGFTAAVPSAHTVCYVERDPHAVAVIRARIEDHQLDAAPIWDDVRTFDGRPWRGLVDLVIAGYPCQGESRAGKRAGADDVRWLWPDIWRIVREVEARWLAIENVADHLTGSWSRVCGQLAESGWRVEWDCVPAAAVGAPHIRDRIFALAKHPEAGSDVSARVDTRAIRARPITDSDAVRWPEIGRGDEPTWGPELDGGDCGASWWADRAAPQPVLLRVDDGAPSRMDLGTEKRAIELMGNACVPQAAELAFRTLFQRMRT